MFPAMLPPPTPFKLFVLAAAVSEMQFSHFLLAIFAGRFVRFLVLSILTLISVLSSYASPEPFSRSLGPGCWRRSRWDWWSGWW